MRFHLFMLPGAWMSVHWRRSFLMVVRSFHLVTALARRFQQEGRRRSPSPTRPSSSRTAGGRGWSDCLNPTTSIGMSGNLWRRPWREGLRETLPLKSHFLLSLTRETFWSFKPISSQFQILIFYICCIFIMFIVTIKIVAIWLHDVNVWCSLTHKM